ncbi:ATP-binding protein [Shewanella glacialipiscicola]|uniref:histidine kinase n=1 Tax=Shewanella glacialipiscicola TaxID=614069 RepID=A0ABQ6J790_9GAMM|nr:ATP-binding protein [Shewanella glacialipiscicola]MCL1086861.1 ATP-binding protein [Shewanella glacialipiscicola]GIU08342.1 two-component sensor histidine kinase [Shewanella glacialipiscicola]GMA83104.1 two-component sensor histidine kinase [Shewanella glacialipiscicola]
MKRLFISLYLLLSLSVLGVGWTLDSLWQKNVDDNNALDAPLVALAQLLAELSTDTRQRYLEAIPANPLMPLQLLNADQVALLDNQALSSNKVFTTTAHNNSLLQFIRVGDQVLMAGPLDIDPRANLRSLFTLFFYLSLALVALIWVGPLSRDLSILRKATKEFGEAKWDTRITLSNRSQVKPLANTFNEMARHISALIENQKHLSNAVSHEIRTPLARLKFALALIPMYCQPDSDAQKRQNFIDEMQIDIKEIEDLLQELLTYASLESQREGIQLDEYDLIQLINQTIKRLESLSPIPIGLKTTIDKLPLLGEPALIERTLQNLLTNAQRFARTAIIIEVKQTQHRVSLSVSNDGEPIPAVDLPKVFEPFYRSQSVQNGNKGHGLGLAIIKRIMQRHQGDVSVSSNPYQTCFNLNWPIKRQL